MAENKKEKQDNFKYKGQISVSLVKKGRVVSTKKFHNNGFLNLFKFLSYALCGRYSIADALRPRYIRLYSLGDEGDAVPQDFALEDADTTSTTFVMYKETPSTEIKEEANNKKVFTNFSFMVPFVQINTNKDTNLLVLYSSANETSPLAYFIVTDEDDSTKLGKLFDKPSGSLNDYNLFINWNMNIDN